MDYPKGARFCPGCGCEPLKRRRSALLFIGVGPVVVAAMVYTLAWQYERGDWLSVILGGLAVSVWVGLCVNFYRWWQWTVSPDSDEATASDS